MKRTSAIFSSWPVRLYYIFSLYLVHGMIFEKNFIYHKMGVLTFSVNSV